MWKIRQVAGGWAVLRDDKQQTVEATREKAIDAIVAGGALEEAGGFVASGVPLTAAIPLDEAMSAQGDRFHGMLIPEGVRTTDGREIDRGALTIRTLPLPLMYQYEEPEFGGHACSVLVGRIDSLAREGDEWIFAGEWDAGYQAAEAMRLCAAQMMRWVSADVEVIDGDIMVEGEGCDIDPFMPQCEWIQVLHEGRIMGGTMVAFPAFPTAVICPENMPIPEAEDNGRKAADQMMASGDCKPCDAKLRRSVRAASVIELPDAPPREWFEAPETGADNHVDESSGRVFGYIAEWGVCHTGYPNECVLAPRSETSYAYFLNGKKPLEDGSFARVGQITMGCGHAPLRVSMQEAAAHYDGGPGAIQVADVVVGEDEFGIWYSGVLRPNVTGDQVREFQALSQSGDWRRARGGSLELVASLSVPVPGFPRLSLAADGSAMQGMFGPAARVLDGEVMALVAAGRRAPQDPARKIAELEARLEAFIAEATDSFHRIGHRLLSPGEAAERIRARVAR